PVRPGLELRTNPLYGPRLYVTPQITHEACLVRRARRQSVLTDDVVDVALAINQDPIEDIVQKIVETLPFPHRPNERCFGHDVPQPEDQARMARGLLQVPQHRHHLALDAIDQERVWFEVMGQAEQQVAIQLARGVGRDRQHPRRQLVRTDALERRQLEVVDPVESWQLLGDRASSDDELPDGRPANSEVPTQRERALELSQARSISAIEHDTRRIPTGGRAGCHRCVDGMKGLVEGTRILSAPPFAPILANLASV